MTGRLARARARGRARAQDPSAVVDSRYDHERDAVNLIFRGGGSMTIPRRMIPGLADASRSALESISISPAGDALAWRALDVDVYVPGLVERVFGTRLLAGAAGRRIRRRPTKSKVVRPPLR